MSNDLHDASFEGWAILELFGHKRMAGFVSSQQLAGGSLVRIDVPATESASADGDCAPATHAYTKLVGVAAVYGVTPCEESIARRAARVIERYNDPIPVQLPALAGSSNDTQLVIEDDDLGDDD